MKAAVFFALAYLAGVHGFALFAPYLAFFLLFAYCVRRIQRGREVRLQPILLRAQPAERISKL